MLGSSLIKAPLGGISHKQAKTFKSKRNNSTIFANSIIREVYQSKKLPMKSKPQPYRQAIKMNALKRVHSTASHHKHKHAK